MKTISPLLPPPPDECLCINIALPCRIANCFSCRFASLNIAKYVKIIIVHGIQNDIELETTAYTLFTSKMQYSGFLAMNNLCSSVVYQPANIGMNDSKAGAIQVLRIITATTFLVIVIGYLRGLTMA